MDPILRSYEELPYQSYARRETSPAAMHAVARLFGIEAASPGSCRALEIGCGTGGNLLPLAELHPGSTFVGIDLAPSHIEEATRVARAIGLTNVSFRTGDISKGVDDSPFDYIICHGVYSWVPAAVREAILRVMKEKLTENGIAFLSYNVKPGASFRSAVRDVMRYHAGFFASAEEQLREATELVRFLVHAKGGATDSYRLALREVLTKLESGQPDYLFHDLLGVENNPFLLAEVVADAQKSGLHYVGDAKLEVMFDAKLPSEVQRSLIPFAGDRVRFETYLDLLENRAFRQSLFARKQARGPDWRVLEGMRFASPLSVLDAAGGKPWPVIKDRFGRDVVIENDIERDTVSKLAIAWPESLDIDRLCQDAVREEILVAVQNLARRGLIELESFPRTVTATIADTPRTTAYARYVSTRNAIVASPLHIAAPLSEVARVIIAQMDGETSRTAIEQTLHDLLDGDDVLEQICAAWKEVVDHGFILAG